MNIGNECVFLKIDIKKYERDYEGAVGRIAQKND